MSSLGPRQHLRYPAIVFSQQASTGSLPESACSGIDRPRFTRSQLLVARKVMMQHHRAFVVCTLLATLAIARPADAQFSVRRPPNPATGESYHVEIMGGWWNATPEMVLSSDEFGIVGTDIDFVSDLGILQKRLRDLRLVLRPARKHKFRIQYVPIQYQADTVLERSVVWRGQRHPPGTPVTTSVVWRAWRFGYEYDFLYRDRWFVGLIVETKYTDIEARLDSLVGNEFARARAPLPAIGGIGRVYPSRNLSVTFELTGFRLPNLDEDYKANYVDLDVYGMVNFSDNFGIQTGYRSLDLGYLIEQDAADIKLKGTYFAGIVRF